MRANANTNSAGVILQRARLGPVGEAYGKVIWEVRERHITVTT